MTEDRLQQIQELLGVIHKSIKDGNLETLTEAESVMLSLEKITMELQQATNDNPNHPNLELIAKLGISSLRYYTTITSRLGMDN